MSNAELHSGAPESGPEHNHHVDRSATPVFELKSISHSYGRNRVIFDVNLAVWPGEVVALVGDNGAGKSTLLKIFAGYQRPTAGTLRFMGKDVQFSTPAAARACRGGRSRGSAPRRLPRRRRARILRGR